MNISTYESRIKALEDQLNPPAPSGPETGLVSVVVTPDITLSDGTTLNARLAALMPMEPGANQQIGDTHAAVVEGTEYTVTVTPGSEWYGIIIGPTGPVFGDTAGTPLSLSITPVVNTETITLGVTTGAVENQTDEGREAIIALSIKGTRSN